MIAKLFGRLRHGTTDDLRKSIINALAIYNRAARRGIYGRLWAWDPRAMGVRSDLPSRYIRRHFTPTLLIQTPSTRRARRHRARILRLLKQQGAMH